MKSRPDTARQPMLPILCCRMLAPRGTCGVPGGASNWQVPVSFVQRTSWRSFSATLRCLRSKCTPAQPVIVRTSWLPMDVLGECVRRKSRFVVRLNRTMNESQATETLLHEWAHALAWNYSLDRMARDPDVDRELFEAASHDAAWGCAYSRVWRAFTLACRPGRVT